MNAPAGPAIKTQRAVTAEGSALRRYQDVVIGSRRLGYTLYFEFCQALAPIPGGLGLVLRKTFWPRLFARCGKGVLFATGVVLRHPGRIALGDRVVISEGCVLDARSTGGNHTITIGDDVIIANHAVISGKEASIEIGPRSSLGAHSVVVATDNNRIRIGADCPLGPHTVIIGGGEYNTGRLDLPMWRQGIKQDLPVTIGDDVWFGAGVTMLGGTRIGDGSIAAAGAVITRPVEPMTIVAGLPAKPLKARVVEPGSDTTGADGSR